MEKIISMPFMYQDSEYHSLVRVFQHSPVDYILRITIMNGELQSKFQGHHIFTIKDGQLQVDVPSEKVEVARLKFQIAEALNKYFDLTHVLNFDGND